MSFTHSRNPSDNLVKLSLVKPFDLDPPPDRSLQGRLEKVLRGVGADGFISVRARMITAISNTKFKTVEGDPVSLVGLHGKDELLVRGPTWAIEMLGQGNIPDPDECKDWLEEQRKHVEQERKGLLSAKGALVRYLETKRQLDTQASRSEFSMRQDSWTGEYSPAYQAERQKYADNYATLSKEYQAFMEQQRAQESEAFRLKEFFGVDTATLSPYFGANDVDAFIEKTATSLTDLASRLASEAEFVRDGGRPWWYQWTQQWENHKKTCVLIDGERHFTRYAFSSDSNTDDLKQPRPSRFV